MTETDQKPQASAEPAPKLHPAPALMAKHAAQIKSGRVVTMISDDPEGPHQLRVGLRRVRSSLSYFSKVLTKDKVSLLSAEAKWLGREAGVLRDLDVLLTETLAKQLKKATTDDGLHALGQQLESARLQAKVQLRKTLAGSRVGRFLASLDSLARPDDWTLPDEGADGLLPLSETVIAKRMGKANTMGDRFATLNEKGRHEFRKELKKLRYSCECAYSLHNRPETQHFVATLKVLQDQLGAMNDAAVAKDILTTETASLPAGAPIRAAADATMRKQSQKAVVDRDKVQALWLDLVGKPPL